MKHWQGVRVRDLRSVYIDVIVKWECIDRRENSCKEQLHLELLFAQLPSLCPYHTESSIPLNTTNPEFAPPRGHASHCSRVAPIHSLPSHQMLDFKTLLISLPPNHEYWPPYLPSRKRCMCLLPSLPFNLFPCVICLPFSSAYPTLTILCSSPWILLSHPEHTERTLGKSLDLRMDETLSSCVLLFCFYLRNVGW